MSGCIPPPNSPENTEQKKIVELNTEDKGKEGKVSNVNENNIVLNSTSIELKI